MRTKKDFVPQITNVKIHDYPVFAGSGNYGVSADGLGEHKLKPLAWIVNIVGGEHLKKRTTSLQRV